MSSLYRKAGKRVLDLALVLVAAPVWLPVFVLSALLLRMIQGPPVFFRQQRPGLDGVVFLILKFRTMRNACDSAGKPLNEENRMTKLGRLLRRTSLDELPELFNVLRGEMSLVGPRPLLSQYLARYSPEQARRHEVLPGITGLAQISGRNSLEWQEKFEFDVWYVENMSIALDLKILSLTVLRVLKGDGLSASGHATMPEFMGDSDE